MCAEWLSFYNVLLNFVWPFAKLCVCVRGFKLDIGLQIIAAKWRSTLKFVTDCSNLLQHRPLLIVSCFTQNCDMVNIVLFIFPIIKMKIFL